jgi:hypothetical protein
MTTLSPPVSDLDLGIDIGVRTGLDLLTREVAKQEALAVLAVGMGADGPDAAARHHYTIAVLGELAGVLGARFRQGMPS